MAHVVSPESLFQMWEISRRPLIISNPAEKLVGTYGNLWELMNLWTWDLVDGLTIYGILWTYELIGLPFKVTHRDL
jgi:hypothetical protein